MTNEIAAAMEAYKPVIAARWAQSLRNLFEDVVALHGPFFVYVSPEAKMHIGHGPLESLAWEHARQVMAHAGNALDWRAP